MLYGPMAVCLHVFVQAYPDCADRQNSSSSTRKKLRTGGRTEKSCCIEPVASKSFANTQKPCSQNINIFGSKPIWMLQMFLGLRQIGHVMSLKQVGGS